MRAYGASWRSFGTAQPVPRPLSARAIADLRNLVALRTEAEKGHNLGAMIGVFMTFGLFDSCRDLSPRSPPKGDHAAELQALLLRASCLWRIIHVRLRAFSGSRRRGSVRASGQTASVPEPVAKKRVEMELEATKP